MAKGDVAVAQCRERCNWWHAVWWRVGKWYAGQADQTFAEQSLRASGSEVGIGEECVHSRHAGAVSVPEQIRHLNRRRAASKRQ